MRTCWIRRVEFESGLGCDDGLDKKDRGVDRRSKNLYPLAPADKTLWISLKVLTAMLPYLDYDLGQDRKQHKNHDKKGDINPKLCRQNSFHRLANLIDRLLESYISICSFNCKLKNPSTVLQRQHNTPRLHH